MLRLRLPMKASFSICSRYRDVLLRKKGYGVYIHDTKSLHAQVKIQSKGTALLSLYFTNQEVLKRAQFKILLSPCDLDL